MNWTVKRVKGRIRSLVDDPSGTWADDIFLDPLIAEAYDDSNSQLASTQSSWDMGLVECPAIEPGTPNLTALQTGTGPLVTLTDKPERIDWKVAGNDPSTYQLVRNYGVLPDLQPQQGMVGWEWRAGIIWVSPSSIVVDLRVRAEFAPPDLSSDDSVLTSHPRIGYVISYGVASIAGIVRGNKGWETSYGLKAEEGMDEIMEQLTRESQNETRRVGKLVRRGDGRGAWNVSTS